MWTNTNYKYKYKYKLLDENEGILLCSCNCTGTVPQYICKFAYIYAIRQIIFFYFICLWTCTFNLYINVSTYLYSVHISTHIRHCDQTNTNTTTLWPDWTQYLCVVHVNFIMIGSNIDLSLSHLSVSSQVCDTQLEYLHHNFDAKY